MISVLNTAPDIIVSSDRMIFNKGESHIGFSGMHGMFNDLGNAEGHEALLDVRSSTRKILLSTNIGMYNFFHTAISTIVKLHRMFPDAEFYIDATINMLESNNKGFVEFLSKVLDGEKISYTVLDTEKNSGIIINNFITLFVGDIDVYQKDFEIATELCRRYADVSNADPYRKVYLSRRNVAPRLMAELPDGLSGKVDDRILDEPILEDFFAMNGFEIVCPEDDFESIEEQINYFNSVKTLVSITSSGITNQMFMQPGSTIVEIVTAFVGPGDSPGTGQESLHLLYSPMSYILNNIYIGIPNHDKLSKTIINAIMNTDTHNILGIKQTRNR